MQRLRVLVWPSVLPEGEHVGDVQGGGWKERRHLSTTVLHPPAPLAWRCSRVHHPTCSWRAITLTYMVLRESPSPWHLRCLWGSITLAPKVLMDSPSRWHPPHLWKAHSIWPLGAAPKGSLGARRNCRAWEGQSRYYWGQKAAKTLGHKHGSPQICVSCLALSQDKATMPEHLSPPSCQLWLQLWVPA